MRFDIRSRTAFAYEPEALESHNEIRACPVTDAHQRLVAYRVGTLPNARLLSFTDYWGTRVDAFGCRLPHRRLEIVAEATVETWWREPVRSAATLADLAGPDFSAEHHEYLQPTRHTEWDDDLAAIAQDAQREAGDDVLSVALAIQQTVRSLIRYESGVTDIGTPVAEVLAGGAGVCQDFAHVASAMCRSVGIPARYVSGYLFTADDSTGEESTGEVVTVQTHAWIEVALPDAGWYSLDPTNGREVGELHVKVGHGRDYDDVCPIHGVYQGGASATVEASVEIRRGESMLRGGLHSMLDHWGDAPDTPVRRSLGTRTPAAMPDLEQEQQQQQQQ